MSNPNLELAFKQFHSIVETIDGKGVAINIKQLRDAMAQGLDVLAEGMREIAEPAQKRRRVVQVTSILASAGHTMAALDEDGGLWTWHKTEWERFTALPDRELRQ
jgi:site-specific recombinase